MELIFTLITADILVVLLICKLYTAAVHRRCEAAESKAHDRLLYIRSLIDLVYTYKNQPQLLIRRLQSEMHVCRLVNCHIVGHDDSTPLPEQADCTKNDRLLYLLHAQGFTPRELCVVFCLNNINSVYVKYHRMNKKLNGALTPEPPASEPHKTNKAVGADGARKTAGSHNERYGETARRARENQRTQGMQGAQAAQSPRIMRSNAVE